MINGEGLYYKDGKPDECVWENDVKFVISSSEGDRIACSIIIALLFYGSLIPMMLSLMMGSLIMISIILYFVMLCEFYFSKTYKYLGNIRKSSEISQILDQLK